MHGFRHQGCSMNQARSELSTELTDTPLFLSEGRLPPALSHDPPGCLSDPASPPQTKPSIQTLLHGLWGLTLFPAVNVGCTLARNLLPKTHWYGVTALTGSLLPVLSAQVFSLPLGTP